MSSESTRPRILIIGDGGVPTGFGRVIRSIFDPLSDAFELHQLATRYSGEPHDCRWPLIPAGSGTSVYGYDQIKPVVDRIQPHIIFLLYDIPFQVPYMKILRESAPNARIVLYSPVEAGPISPEMMEHLQGVSRYVMYTEYGRREIAKALAIVRERLPDFQFPELQVIPHGVDCEAFFPLTVTSDTLSRGGIEERRIIARRSLGFQDAEHVESFIVLNANRNMPRKRIDLTMQGFARFAENKPRNVKLYLHMATEDTGWNVLILAKRYGIYDRLIMTQVDNTRPRFPDAKMNVLYNACDVGLTTTTGEGWGMVSFEHAATRAAQVIPRHTSLADLWSGAAEFVDPVMTLTNAGNLTDAYIVTPEGVASSLERLYQDEDYRNAIAEAGFRNARRPEYRWSSVAAAWKELFLEVIER